MAGTPDAEYTATRSADGGAMPGIARFVVETGLRTDTWIRALALQMRDRRTARAAFFSVLDTGDYVGGWTPLHTATEFPAGTAFRLPAGARIAIDVLHGPAAISAPPRLALYFSAAPTHALRTVRVTTDARSSVRRVEGDRRIDDVHPVGEPLTVVGLRTEMTAGGKSIEVRARRADGRFEPLVWIKDFRQDWQVPFMLKSPVVLPPGSVLHATSYFEDSANGSNGSTVHLIGY
jgi:hypothetical protein